ncbi:lipid II-degrading bacteriocin [Pseudomonas sp. Q1-7]|uniref:lipid II-degrading bacteriocin n=1 Tax=Pseudomonas sp. Q1-7 TaxID=3020843 RepID=UPI002301511A|nr:lipid II-degrading bacteriocin [Pseudomonas sp. Q1-7]
MAIELPPMVIYPDDFGTARPSGLPAPFPAAMIGRMIEERNSAYAQGHWREMFTRHIKMMKYNRPTPYKLDGIIIQDFKSGFEADLLMLKNPSLSPHLAWSQGVGEARKNKDVSQMATPIEFSGGLYTPFKAIGHWIFGNGQVAKVNINNIGITPTPQKIPQLKAAIDNSAVGTSQLDISFPYYTGMDSAISRIYLGNITLRIVGKITKDPDNRVRLEGVVRAYSDVYDANASSHRGEFDEDATTALREIGRIANAKNYEILIEGELPITYKK